MHRQHPSRSASSSGGLPRGMCAASVSVLWVAVKHISKCYTKAPTAGHVKLSGGTVGVRQQHSVEVVLSGDLRVWFAAHCRLEVCGSSSARALNTVPSRSIPGRSWRPPARPSVAQFHLQFARWEAVRGVHAHTSTPPPRRIRSFTEQYGDNHLILLGGGVDFLRHSAMVHAHVPARQSGGQGRAGQTPADSGRWGLGQLR